MLDQLYGGHEIEDSGISSDSSDAGISYSDSDDHSQALDSSTESNFGSYNTGKEIVNKTGKPTGFCGTGGKKKESSLPPGMSANCFLFC